MDAGVFEGHPETMTVGVPDDLAAELLGGKVGPVMIAVDKGNLVHWAAPVPVPEGGGPVDPEGDAAYWRAKYENVCSALKKIHGLIEEFEAGVESLGDGQFKFWADDLVSLGWAKLFAEKPNNFFAEAPVPAPVPVEEEK